MRIKEKDGNFERKEKEENIKYKDNICNREKKKVVLIPLLKGFKKLLVNGSKIQLSIKVNPLYIFFRDYKKVHISKSGLD